ncbi:hypothetical protein Bbelb_064170 [Branchiostoma belcheri]|nr:hypothetical protein Bbelb_064170 [Branchiostoma belcheri]
MIKAVGQSTVSCFYWKGPDKQTSGRVYQSNKSQWGRVERRQSVRLRTKSLKSPQAPAASVRDEAITSPEEAVSSHRPAYARLHDAGRVFTEDLHREHAEQAPLEM